MHRLSKTHKKTAKLYKKTTLTLIKTQNRPATELLHLPTTASVKKITTRTQTHCFQKQAKKQRPACTIQTERRCIATAICLAD